MKKFILAFICIGLSYGYSFAQQNTSDKTDVKNNLSIHQKGYYGIGNNARKMESPVLQLAAGQEKVSKGYYSIGDSYKKLAPASELAMGSDKKSSATKGYYSIGDNHKKLETPGVIVLGRTDEQHARNNDILPGE